MMERDTKISRLQSEIDEIKKKLKLINETDVKIEVIKEESDLVPPIDKLSNTDVKTESKVIEDSEIDKDQMEYCELTCDCGYEAVQRLSRTSKNPLRIFFNCPRRKGQQCEYFEWGDEINVREKMCYECRDLLEPIRKGRFIKDEIMK